MYGKLADDGGHVDARRVYLSGGTAPPKPPPPSKIGLTEVERAISVLEGRHPDHEKVVRQTREAVENRARALEVELARRARMRRVRAIVLGASTAIGALALLFVWKVARRTRTIQAALDAAEGPWLARGFTRVASNALTASHDLEADLPASSCFVATATAPGRLQASVNGTAFDGPQSIAWCSCGKSQVAIRGPESPSLVGLTVLRVDASALGGRLARSWIGFTPGGWGDGGDGGGACADAMLDGWIAARHWPTPALDEGWLEAKPSRASLRESGFRVVGAVEKAHPFGIVETTAGDCTMAIGDPGESLSLRATGGDWLVSHARGALVWCSSAPTTLTVWRDGASPVAVLASSASRIGGVLGARECAAEAGIRLAPEAAWLRDEDLPFDAGALLRSSTLSDITTSVLHAEAESPDARIAALALPRGTSVLSEPDAAVACDPPLAVALGEPPRFRESICAHGAPISWLKKTGSAGASARAPLPFWLSSFEGHREADAVARIPELLSLARHLARRGFEPTRFEGLTELPRGVRVTGRAGEDAVVAVGFSAKPPWILPYSDGVPWDLGDAPRVVSLKAGDAVTLTSSQPSFMPLSARRTVVFRHATTP